MADQTSWGALPPFKKAPLPPMPGMLRTLGPGVVFMALAQGSGELIFWPYTIAKYGLTFLFLLIPACLLQFPVIYEIGRYTLLTGESIFQGFIRLNRHFAFVLWVLMALSFLWFGAFAAAGGTSIAALTDYPAGWSRREQTLFWAYATDGVVPRRHLAQQSNLQTDRSVHVGRGDFHLGRTHVGQCECRSAAPRCRPFSKDLMIPQWPMPRPWDPADATKLLTAITFAGLGGFWTLFYSYWLRDKGAGMAHYMGRLTGPITGKPESIPDSGSLPRNDEGLAHVRHWNRFMFWDIGIGVSGNLITTLLTCLLAYALLFPKGLLPQGYEIAVVQSRFFEASWGWWGKVFFLDHRRGVSLRHLARHCRCGESNPCRLRLRLFSR